MVETGRSGEPVVITFPIRGEVPKNEVLEQELRVLALEVEAEHAMKSLEVALNHRRVIAYRLHNARMKLAAMEK